MIKINKKDKFDEKIINKNLFIKYKNKIRYIFINNKINLFFQIFYKNYFY
jgi:hypothetical protein